MYNFVFIKGLKRKKEKHAYSKNNICIQHTPQYSQVYTYTHSCDDIDNDYEDDARTIMMMIGRKMNTRKALKMIENYYARKKGVKNKACLLHSSSFLCSRSCVFKILF